MAHQVKDAVIRVRALDSGWETISTDRAVGIAHENLELEWDPWGPSGASFDLRRGPRTPWPDIVAFTDVEIEVGGVQVWKGRVKGTPTRDGADQSMNVQCEGLQAHLDDDTYIPFYVHTRLADWRDRRPHVNTNLLTSSGGSYPAAPTVTSDRGGITIAHPRGTVFPSASRMGVYLDAGPGQTIKRVVVTYKAAVDAGSFQFSLYACDSPFGSEDAYTLDNDPISTTTATVPQTLTTARRYVSLVIEDSAGADQTPTQDMSVQISAIQCFRDTAYESGNTSALKASTVVTDALAKATVLLDPDRTLIQATSFNLPELAGREDRTPREVITAVNAFHNYMAKIDERGRPVFAPLPSAPTLEVGEWAALEGTDASQNNGEDIYNRAIVSGQSPTGEAVRFERSQGQRPGAVRSAVASPAPANPGFETDTSNWSVVGGTITRTTTAGEFSAGAAGGKWAISAGVYSELTAVISGTFTAGITYVLSFDFRTTAASTALAARLGTATDYGVLTNVYATSFTGFLVTWTPAVSTSGVTFRLATDILSPGAITALVDNLALFKATPTLVDRRGFRRTKRLPISAALPTDGVAGYQIADTYLATHKNAQFKGDYQVVGPVREVLTGKPVPPEQVGMRTLDLLRFTDRIDPDTGAVGRDGRIVAVTYRLQDDSVSMSIDNTSANYEAMLARYGSLQGDAT